MNLKGKLWWAQHRTDAYKYGTILSLILIVTISIIYFTYSKFTSTNEVTAYETTVEPFIKNDYFIASYIDGVWSNEIPGKNDGYVVEKIVCDNGAVGEWDYDDWGIKITNATQKIKCGVYFIKGTAFKILGKTIVSSEIATDDPDNNIRYFGADPNNYIYFNCSDYSNQNATTCEKWRIIGVFKNVTKSDGTKEDLVKVIRNEILNNTTFIWDYKKNVGTSTSNSSNDWTDSQLMMMLNPTDYLKTGYTIENSIIKDNYGNQIYKNMGSYYNGTTGCQPASISSGSSFNCTSVDFSSTGLKNAVTRNAIESVVWNLGGTDYSHYSTSSAGLASHWYGYERGTTVYSGHATTWTGKIGLMYPSDYGYATAGGSTINKSSCLSLQLYNWGNIGKDDCKTNDYLFNSNYEQWTMTPVSEGSTGTFRVNDSGFVGYLNTTNYYSVRPTLYLKSSVSISKGDGSSSNPYQLKLN